jgi:hypothetical protein
MSKVPIVVGFDVTEILMLTASVEYRRAFASGQRT